MTVSCVSFFQGVGGSAAEDEASSAEEEDLADEDFEGGSETEVRVSRRSEKP